MKEASVSSISTNVLIQSLSFILDLLILVDLLIDYSGLYCTALEEYACSTSDYCKKKDEGTLP